MILLIIKMKMIITMKLEIMKILLMLNKELKILKNRQNSLYLIQKKLKLIILKILKSKKLSHNNQSNNLKINNQRYNRINKNPKVYLILTKNMV